MRLITGFLALTIWFWPLWASAQEVRLDAPEASDDLRRVLRAASLTYALQRDGAEAPQDYIAAARADYRRLLTGLYAEGYYGGVISILVDGREAAALDPLTPIARVDSIVLRVTPGPRFRFGEAEVGPLAPETALPETFATGEVARAETIRDATQTAIDGWRADGRALARVEAQQITARHPTSTLDAAVRIAPGPVLSYGDIAVSGAENVRPERVREIAGLLPNHRFNPEEIARAEANLRRTGTFTSATIAEGDTAGPNDTLPMEIQVVEQVPRRLGFGAEYSSIKGLTLSGYWLHRNLLGGAERFRVEAEVTGLSGGTGGIDYSLGASFLRPATLRSDVDFYAEAMVEQLDEPNFFERQVGVEAGLIRRIREEAVIEVGLGYRAGKIDDDLGFRSYRLLTFPIEGTRDQRDDPFDATRGYYANLEIIPFVGLSNVDNGARIMGDFRYYNSPGEADRVTLAFRGQIGAVFGAEAANVPADFLFYSGGGGTVRGQPYQSLAVDLGGGLEIGGTGFVGLQSEARFDVTDTIGVVGFYDVGFVGSEALDFSAGDWHSGAGVGLRYDTGIGPIRLDLATPASGPDAGNRLEVYIGIGQAF